MEERKTIYNPKTPVIEITRENCEEITGWDPELLIELTGVYGTNKWDIQPEILGVSTAVTVRINTPDNSLHLSRTFYLDKMIVSNDLFECDPTGHGTGYEIFNNQVALCRKHGFKRIRCNAFKDEIHNGHYTWARFGFIIEEKYIKGVREHLIRMQWKESTHLPHEIVKNSEWGEWWKVNGITWSGIFDLHPDSLSNKILYEYAVEKGYRGDLE